MTPMHTLRLRAATIFAAAALAWLLSALPGGAQGTSTINPNVPAQNSPLLSAPVRGNFLAAYNDINALYAQTGTMFTGTSCPGNLKPFQFFANTNAAPTGNLMQAYDGTTCVTWGQLDQTNHLFYSLNDGTTITPPNNGLGLVVTQTNGDNGQGLGNYNSFLITADTQNCGFCNQVYAEWHHGGSASIRGARTNFFSWIIQTAISSGTGTTADSGAAFVSQTNTGEVGGTYFGVNPIVRATGPGLNTFGAEVDVQLDAAYTGQYNAGVAVANFAAAQGSVFDAAYAVYSGGVIGAAGGGGPWGPGGGFHCGLCIAEFSSNGLVPLDSNATFIGTKWTSLNNVTVLWGIDLGTGAGTANTGLLYQAGGGAFRSKGFMIDPNGKVILAGATDRNNAMDIGPDTGTNVVQINGGTGGSGGGIVSFAAGGTNLSDIGFPSAMFGGAFDGTLGVFGFNGVRFFAGTGANTFDFQTGPNTTRVLDYNITNSGKWTFGTAIVDPTGGIFGGSAANSSLILTSTTNVAPSGDTVVLRGSRIAMQNVAGSVSWLDYNVTTSSPASWTMGAPLIVQTTGNQITAQGNSTGGANVINVNNSGTVATAGTVAEFLANLTAGTNTYLQMFVQGGAGLNAVVGSGSGLTNGITLFSGAGPAVINGFASVQFKQNGTLVGDYNAANANLWTFARAAVINVAANDNLYLRGHVSLASGGSITSIDSTLATFKPFEFIGSQFQFTDGGGDRLDFGVSNGTTWTFLTAVSHTSSIVARGTPPTGNTGTCNTSVTVGGGVIAGTWTSTAVCNIAGTIILSGFPTAPTGYSCDANDRTTAAVVLQQTASSATSATFTVRATNMAANDNVSWKCVAY